MSKRRQGSASESLAEALSRVMVTRDEADHRETYEWATQEGRGDRMPRFLERAIQEVPHASRMTRASGSRYEGRSTRPFARATLIMSVVAVGVGVGVSMTNPNAVAPLIETTQNFLRTATVSMTFASDANAAMPRLAFGEALRNYSLQAAAQEARANIVVSDLTPGTTLSAGEPVSDTAWTLPQSELDHLVITFPTGAPAAAMRATVEIPGNTAASSGKFSVELRQAAEEDAAIATPAPPAAAADQPSEPPAPAVEPEEPVAKTPAKNTDIKPVKRKAKPTAALTGKPTAKVVANTAANAAKSAAKSLPTIASASTSSESNSSGESKQKSSLFGGLFPFNSPSPNALTMFSLGGPVTE